MWVGVGAGVGVGVGVAEIWSTPQPCSECFENRGYHFGKPPLSRELDT